MNKELSDLLSKIIRPIYLQITDNKIASFLGLIFVFIIMPPIITIGQHLVTTIPYITIFTNIFNIYTKSFTITDSFLLVIILICIYWIYKLHQEYSKSKTIVEKFDKDLNSWNIPVKSQWTTDKCNDVGGKMLCVTDSGLPGTLKAAYEWYDYELSFSAKMTNDTTKTTQMIGVMIRSENNNNGIFLQFSKKEFRPHLLNNGRFYIDDKKIEPMKIILRANGWIKFFIKVKGDSVDIWINDFKLYYRIPTYTFNVDNSLPYNIKKLSELEDSDKQIQNTINKWISTYEKSEKETDTIKKEELNKNLASIVIPPNSRLIFEYPRGSIGFRESGDEKAFFRNVKLRKI